ncbi:hypothetical protein HK405_015010 [Cladochytrium tenue]|nr:hypothetical protein HK405_015010 [Cladochytrium tenue]
MKSAAQWPITIDQKDQVYLASHEWTGIVLATSLPEPHGRGLPEVASTVATVLVRCIKEAFRMRRPLKNVADPGTARGRVDNGRHRDVGAELTGQVRSQHGCRSLGRGSHRACRRAATQQGLIWADRLLRDACSI